MRGPDQKAVMDATTVIISPGADGNAATPVAAPGTVEIVTGTGCAPAA